MVRNTSHSEYQSKAENNPIESSHIVHFSEITDFHKSSFTLEAITQISSNNSSGNVLFLSCSLDFSQNLKSCFTDVSFQIPDIHGLY